MHAYNDGYKFLISLVDLAVPDSCVEMEYYDEAPSLSPNYEECYDKGGRLMYSTDATYLGTCAEKIPCGTTSIENVHIHHYVCESYEDYFKNND